jgi:hypothetical protein
MSQGGKIHSHPQRQIPNREHIRHILGLIGEIVSGEYSAPGIASSKDSRESGS